jgi:mRNA-degrading endonuclease toxin of MazEF toxin-antitoxin module
VKRGDVRLVNLDPTVCNEIKKARPCVMVSPAELNELLRTVIVPPMTSKGFAAPSRVPVTHAGAQRASSLSTRSALLTRRVWPSAWGPYQRRRSP